MARHIEKIQGGRGLIGDWADDGYEWMENARREGWSIIAGWGQDGWDLGDWPYVVYAFRHIEGQPYERASYCEGDVTIERYANEQDRSDDTDETALFYWLAREESWVDGLTQTEAPLIPSHLRGPYRVRTAI